MTKTQAKQAKALSAKNNALRFFTLKEYFKAKLIVLPAGDYELTGTRKIGRTWVHEVKRNNITYTLSDIDYEKIKRH